MASEHREHQIKRVLLPSGKTIEVVYFSDADREPAAVQPSAAPVPAPAAPEPEAARGLHVCPTCESELVHPTDWSEAGSQRWQVTLRCPNCEWHGEGLFGQEVVDWFDEELDNGTDALVRDLKRLTRANMEDEIERFVSALVADAVLPEDF